MKKTGVLLINLGTPDNCDPKSVYRYLKQFLNDPRVIDLPTAVRYFLVNYLIVPLRFKKSSHAYQQIWSEKGSPLLVNSIALVDNLRDKLDTNYQIELGMRYGNPSIQSALLKLQHCEKIIVIPLFPQYSSAATGSAIQEVLDSIAPNWNIPQIHIINNFFNNPDFISAYANVIQENIKNKKIDMIIFSYHGLPERHINKSVCRSECSRINACPQVEDLNTYCYRNQCYETSRLLAINLDLSPTQYEVTFQSRLGKTPWIKPYTDLVLPDLTKRNIENIAIVCPSFVSDCLETLEEINIRARAQWKELGGKDFTFIPCINDHPIWVNGLLKMINSLP